MAERCGDRTGVCGCAVMLALLFCPALPVTRVPRSKSDAAPLRSIANNNADSTTRPSKRTRTKSSKPAVVTLEGALSEEILLLCLSFLEVDDLLVLARVSSSWNRLTQDPEVRPHHWLIPPYEG